MRVITHDRILAAVWGYDLRGRPNIIEVYIRALRIKLGKQPQTSDSRGLRGGLLAARIGFPLQP